MAHNLTLNYGGVTPSMVVFGTMPHDFYNPESEGVLSITGSEQRTGLSVFERALRIRQTSLAQAHQAVIEDRAARAARTRPHQLEVGKLVQGTSEVEFYREVKQDPGWRGPALLLRLDADEGVAIIQYQGKPYLVSLRHIRPYHGIYHFTLPSEETDQSLNQLMRYTESLTDHKVYTYGWFLRGNKWVRFPKDEYMANKVLIWLEKIYKGMSKHPPHGALLGKALKSIKPPHGTTGHLILCITGGRGFSVQEHLGDGFLKTKRVSNHLREDICLIYIFRYDDHHNEPISTPPVIVEARQDADAGLDVTEASMAGELTHISDEQMIESRKRDGPDSQSSVPTPEHKKQKINYLINYAQELEFLRLWYAEEQKHHAIQLDYSPDWSTGYQLMTQEVRRLLYHNYEVHRRSLPVLFSLAGRRDEALQACLRTARIYKVDTETNNIEERDITPENWHLIEEADYSEIGQFVQEKAFKKIHRSKVDENMVQIDAIWVRKWKRYPDGSLKVKSRMCARGCFDQQKGELTTRSTTVTRLSQRLLVSHAAQDKRRGLESL